MNNIWNILLIDEFCERAQPSVDGATTGQMILGVIGKQAEQATRASD